MSCEAWSEKLDAYVDGEGAPDVLAGVAAHLRECPGCARDALGRMQMKRAVHGAALRYAPPPEFRLRVQQSIRKDRRTAWSLAWRPGLLSAVAALLLLVACALVWTRHAERQQAIAELVDLHVATLASANPVDVVSTDRHTVKPWFQGKVPFAFNLPELANTQFKLLGGKVIYFNNTAGAQLLYTSGKHQLSVFISQDQPGLMPAALIAGSTRAHGFNIETWSQNGLRFAVVSDTNSGDIHALSELLKAAGRS
jgi:anti-sigma factor RsiW